MYSKEEGKQKKKGKYALIAKFNRKKGTISLSQEIDGVTASEVFNVLESAKKAVMKEVAKDDPMRALASLFGMDLDEIKADMEKEATKKEATSPVQPSDVIEPCIEHEKASEEAQTDENNKAE